MSKPSGRFTALRAVAFVSFSTYFTYGLSLVVGAIAARSLGPQEYGRYAYVVWLTGLIVLIGNNGITTSGIRFVAESLGRGQNQEASAVHGWLAKRQTASLILALAFLTVWILVTPPKDWRENLVPWLILVAICVAAKTYYLFYISIAKGYSNFSIDPKTTLVTSVIGGIGTLFLSYFSFPVIYFVSWFSATCLLTWWLGRQQLQRNQIIPRYAPLNEDLNKEIRHHLLWTIVLTTSGLLSNKSVETYLLSIHYGSAEVGFFTIAIGLTRGSIELLTVGISAILMPSLAKAHGTGDPQASHRIFSDSLRYLAFLGLVLAGGAFWAKPLVEAVYGTQFLPAGRALEVMLLVGGLTLVNATTGALLTTSGQQQRRAIIALFAAAIPLLQAPFLIPRYGLMGATISVAITSTAYCMTLSIQATRITPYSLPWQQLLRLTLAATVSAATPLLIINNHPTFIAHLIGGPLYTALLLTFSILFRAWSAEDINLVIETCQKSPRLLGKLIPLFTLWQKNYSYNPANNSTPP